MGSSKDREVERSFKKWEASELAQFRLQQRWDAIDWRIDVLETKREEIREALANGIVPTFALGEGKSA